MRQVFRCISCGVRVRDTVSTTTAFGRLCKKCWTAYLIGRKEAEQTASHAADDFFENRLSVHKDWICQIDAKLHIIVKYLAKDGDFVKYWDEAKKDMRDTMKRERVV